MFSLQTSGIRSQSRSSIIVIGQKYVNRFDIMLKVDRIREDTQALPSDIFLQSEKEIKIEDMSAHRMHETPGLVGILKLSY